MFAALKSIHYVALLVLCGAPFFWHVVWRPVYGDRDDEITARFATRVRYGVMLGAILFVISGLAEAVRVASQVIELQKIGELWKFLRVAYYGQISLLKVPLALVFAALCLCTYRRASVVGRIGTAILGLGIVCTISLTSHAAARPDLIPFISDIVHVLAAVIWGGGLLCFAGLPWGLLGDDLQRHTRSIGKLVERFSAVAMLATLALATTGAIAAFLHVYGPEAFAVTPYGRTLLSKMAMFVCALGIAGVHLLVFGPGLKRQVRRFNRDRAMRLVRRLRVLVRIEAGLILCGMGLAGVLTTFNPADRPGHIVRQDWQRRVGTMQIHLSMVPMDNIGRVQFEVLLQPQNGVPIPSETQVSLYMRMVDHDMGISAIVAAPVKPGQYAASSLVSMAGDWQVAVSIQPPQASVMQTTVAFEAPTGALDLGRVRRLDVAPILFTWVNGLTFVMAVLILALGGFTMWLSQRGRLPLWATPFSLILIILGGGLSLNIVLVDTYPTAYLKNPLPLELPVVQRGVALFQTHCTTCHGPEGRGDGPAAAGLNPKPADLKSEHVDTHTDGDLFWWLTYGIAGSAMPNFETTLSDTNRWELIRYIRSIRHGVPGSF